MPKEYARIERINELIQRKLATLFSRSFNIQETGLMTITHVDVSKDLRHAKIYITCLQGQLGAKELLAMLHNSSKTLRYELGHMIRLKQTPELHFYYDDSVETGARISGMLRGMEK